MDQEERSALHRVAVLLSGNIRDLESTSAILMSSVVDALDADVFIHTWDITDHRDPTWWRTADEADRHSARTDPELVARLLRPVSMIVEPPRTFSTRSVPACEPDLKIPLSAIMSLWFGVSESFRLMQEHESVRGVRYEHVVRWRFDLLPSRPLSVTDLDDRLRLARWSHSRSLMLSSDVAAVGPRDLMGVYSSVFSTLPASADHFVADSGYRGFSHEAFLGACLQRAGLEWTDLDLGTTLHRSDGSQQVISDAEYELRPSDFDPDRLDHFLLPSEGERISEFLRVSLENAGYSDPASAASALLSSRAKMTRLEALQSFRVLRPFADWLLQIEPNGRSVAPDILHRWWNRYRRSTPRWTRLRAACSLEFWSLWRVGAPRRLRLQFRTRMGRMKRALAALPGSIRSRRPVREQTVTAPRSLPSREFNEVIVDSSRSVVRKTSQHAQTLLDEIGYLNELPSSLLELFAPVHGFSVDPDAVFLELGFVEGRPLDQLFLEDAGSIAEWSSIWNSVGTTIDRLAGHRRQVSEASLLDMYIDKTGDRLAACREFPDLRRLLERPSLVINGVEHRSLESLVQSARERVIATATGAHGSVIHGDLCLSNMLRSGDTITLIDPRGRFGDVGVHGDLRYDIAKLHHSVVGGYDLMVAGRFSFDIGSIDIEFDLQFTARQLEIADAYRDRILSGWSADEIELISGLILAGLAPLHSESPNRQLAFLLRATQMLSSVLDGTRRP